MQIKTTDIEKVNEGFMIKTVRTKTTNKPIRFLLPAIVQNSTVSPAGIFGKYYGIVCPWLASRNVLRIWPRPTKSGFSIQMRGVNHIGLVAKKIATFLVLDPSSYTGHSFRRSSATSDADGGISLINLKRFGGWRSDSVASSYVDDSLVSSVEAAKCLAPKGPINVEMESCSSNSNPKIAELQPIKREREEETTEANIKNKRGQFIFNIIVNQK